VIDASTIASAAQLACLLEVSAPKPGNVSPGRHFADTRYEHFLASAVALGAPLAGAGEQPVGQTVRRAIEATAQWTRTNTNLGIVLLFAPLARAALVSRIVDSAGGGSELDRPECTLHRLRAGARHVLDATTVEDARDVYAAIRRAQPGGLGEVDAQDVSVEPTASLLEVMRLAAHRDGIAREYATGFEVTFERGVPALARARRDGLSWDDAVVETFLTLLAGAADTHVVRRAGARFAEDISRRAAAALDAGGVRSEPGRGAIAELDAGLRGPRNAGNPGTTADLTAAAIFVFLLAGGWARSVRL
jgi:triphosphoribosyl-dephospho-CoA synthase